MKANWRKLPLSPVIGAVVVVGILAGGGGGVGHRPLAKSPEQREVLQQAVSAVQLRPGDSPSSSAAEVHFSGGTRLDDQRLGPEAFTLGPDGTSWIVDGEAQRLVRFDSDGDALPPVALPDQAVGPLDLAVTEDSVFVATVGGQSQAVYHLTHSGAQRGRYDLPGWAQELEGTPAIRATGLHLADGNVPAVEIDGGLEFLVLARDGTFQRTETLRTHGVTFYLDAYRGAPLNEPPPNPQIVLNGERPDMGQERGWLYSYRLVGVDPSGRVAVEVSRMGSPGVETWVDVRDSKSGALIERVAVPLEGRHAPVANGLVMNASGRVVSLESRPQGVELRLLGALEDRNPDDSQMPHTSLVSASLQGRSAPMANALPAQAGPMPCSQANTILTNTSAWFLFNSTHLNSTAINGSCSGRTKPRYLGGAGNYGSVSYAWGKYHTPDWFNWFTASGYQAGNITKTVPGSSCVFGTDCSGYVQTVWQYGHQQGYPKISTWGIPALGTEMISGFPQTWDVYNDAGNHTLLFWGYSGNGFHTNESTTRGQVDRVAVRTEPNFNYVAGWKRFRHPYFMTCY
jgi:hypothetical protein